MKPGNDDDGKQEAKGPPSAPLPPPAYYREEGPGRANNENVSSSSSQQQQHHRQQTHPQYPRIVAIPNEHRHYDNSNTINTNWDPEAAEAAEFASQFAEAEARAGFVRRVLSIVSAQLVLTAAMTLLFFFSRGARSFLLGHAYTIPLSWVLGFAISTTVRFKRSRRFSSERASFFFFFFFFFCFECRKFLVLLLLRRCCCLPPWPAARLRRERPDI